MARNVAQAAGEVQTIVLTATGTTDLDVSRYQAFDISLAAFAQTFTFSEQDSQSHLQRLTFVIRQGTASSTVAWPANVKAVVPTLSTVAAKVDVLEFVSTSIVTSLPVWRAAKTYAEGTA